MEHNAPSLRIAPAEGADRDALADLLSATVAGNGSVGFMHPLGQAEARAFWDGALASAARGERIILCAWRDGRLLATGTLVLVSAPSQPHRAELTKVMTVPAERGTGIGARLVQAPTLHQHHRRVLCRYESDLSFEVIDNSIERFSGLFPLPAEITLQVMPDDGAGHA